MGLYVCACVRVCARMRVCEWLDGWMSSLGLSVDIFMGGGVCYLSKITTKCTVVIHTTDS